MSPAHLAGPPLGGLQPLTLAQSRAECAHHPLRSGVSVAAGIHALASPLLLSVHQEHAGPPDADSVA